MQNFDDAFDALIGHEGTFFDDPVGGPTMWGVTEKVARQWGYKGDMRDLPLNYAKTIARKAYWEPHQCDQLPPVLAFQVFDTAYNGGYAAKWLQEAVGANPDGIIGTQTIAKARQADIGKALAAFNGKRLLYMTGLNNWTPNSKGWARRIAKNLIEGAQ